MFIFLGQNAKDEIERSRGYVAHMLGAKPSGADLF